MKAKFFTILCSSAMLLGFVACSNSGSGADANNSALSLPAIEGAPSASALTANNAIAATPEQISEDLNTLSETAELGSMVTEMSNFSSESPVGGSEEKAARKKAFASSEESDCFEIDTSEVDGNDTISMQWLKSDGSVLRLCDSDYDSLTEESATNQLYSMYNGSVFSEQIKSSTDGSSLELNLFMTMYFDKALDEDYNPVFNRILVSGNLLYSLNTSTGFSIYAEFAETAYPSGDTAMVSDVSMIYWFSNGRYKCDMSDYIASNASEGEVCKLVNAGNTVGSLYQNSDGDIYVKDANGIYVINDQPTQNICF
ncbi:MAG: hypothetical protein M0P13_09350 [Fibrobacteraceae bacterium]|nr:hypothetical protein [Fibrobacteraceae bacterium]